MLLANPIWQHGFLLAAWFALHLMSYPFLNLFKGRNLALYRRWSWIYGVASMVFALAGMGAYYFPDRIFDYKIWWVALYPTLYVKSMMRERKNPCYLQISLVYHVIGVLILLFLQQYWLTVAFVIPLVHTFFAPKETFCEADRSNGNRGIYFLFSDVITSYVIGRYEH